MKNIGIIFVLLSPVLLTGCISNIKKDELKAHQQLPESYLIQDKTFLTSETYIGHIDSDQNTMISAKIGGRVETIYIEEGTEIKKGALIAKLDTAESEINYESSANILSSLQQSYQDTKDMFDAQIQAVNEKVKQAKVARELSEISDAEGIGNAGRKIEQSKLTSETKTLELAHNINILEQQEFQLYSNALNAFGQAKILMENIGDFSDELLGASDLNKDKNNAFEAYLGAKDVKHKNKVQNTRPQFKSAYNDLDIAGENNNYFSGGILSQEDKTSIYQKLLASELFLSQIKEFLEELNTLLDNSVAGANLTTTAINNYKTTINSYLVNTENTLLSAQGSYLLGIKGSKQSIENFNNQSEMQIDLLQKQQELIAQQFEVDKESLLQGNTIAGQQYQEALANLNAFTKQKDAQLSQIQSQIAQTRGQNALANQNLDNANIYAPYDGTILKQHTEIGQIIGPGTPMFEFANTANIILKITVSESLARSLTIGQTGTAYFDTIDKEYILEISKIAVSSDILSKKREIELIPLYYENDLSIGMYAKIHLENKQTTASKQLTIPNDFIEYQYGNAYIYKTIQDKDTNTNIITRIAINIETCADDFCKVDGEIKLEDIIIKK